MCLVSRNSRRAPACRAGGAITGTITDAQNALIAGAMVEAKNLDTGTVVRTTSNSNGIYVLPYLAVGHYDITVSASGLKQSVRGNVELRVGDRLQLDFAMQLGAVSEQVSVTGEAALLETATAGQGQVIDTKTISDLPLLGRNPVMLTLLSTRSRCGPAASTSRISGTRARCSWMRRSSKRFPCTNA